MNEPISTFSGEDELTWLAEQYVLGELDASSRYAFEVRLEADQIAREAVAQATMLVAAIHGAETPASVSAAFATKPKVEAGRSRIGWIAAIAVAILVGAFWASQVSRIGNESANSLASAWSETRESAIQENEQDQDISGTEFSAEAPEELDAPDWLVTAMRLQEVSPAGIDERGGFSKEKPLIENSKAGEGA